MFQYRRKGPIMTIINIIDDNCLKLIDWIKSLFKKEKKSD